MGALFTDLGIVCVTQTGSGSSAVSGAFLTETAGAAPVAPAVMNAAALMIGV